MLWRALAAWSALPSAERISVGASSREAAPIERAERFYPQHGLALQVFSRDLPRAHSSTGRWGQAWNNDFAWMTREEARSLLPATIKVGERQTAPQALVQRLACLSLVDNVRGQTGPLSARDVRRASLTATITSTASDIADVRLDGETHTEAAGRWSISGYRDLNTPSDQERGIQTRILGKAKFDLKSERFVEFEMLALGERWGATQYNGRSDDLAPAPIGFAFRLASGAAAERVAPAHFLRYGWK